MFTSVNSRAAAAYKRIGAETMVSVADPHALVGMLYDGLLQSIHEARGALRRGDMAAKGAALGKAVRILDEGLKAGLNLREGGDVAANLRQLYSYSSLRLTQGNLRNDARALEEVLQLIEPVAQSWKSIRTAATPMATRTAGQGA